MVFVLMTLDANACLAVIRKPYAPILPIRQMQKKNEITDGAAGVNFMGRLSKWLDKKYVLDSVDDDWTWTAILPTFRNIFFSFVSEVQVISGLYSVAIIIM